MATSDADPGLRTPHRVQVPSHLTLAVATAVVVANLVLFALIAEDLLDGGGLISHDKAVTAWFVEHRTDALISAAKVVSALGSFVSLSIVGVLVRHLVVAARVARGTGGGPAGVTRAREPRLHRHQSALRPGAPARRVARHQGHAGRVPIRSRDRRGGVLPRRVTTLAITIARHRSTRALLVATGLFLAALVGLSRLVLGVHWLSDVVAGWALGSAIATAVVVTLWWLSTRQHDLAIATA